MQIICNKLFATASIENKNIKMYKMLLIYLQLQCGKYKDSKHSVEKLCKIVSLKPTETVEPIRIKMQKDHDSLRPLYLDHRSSTLLACDKSFCNFNKSKILTQYFAPVINIYNIYIVAEKISRATYVYNVSNVETDICTRTGSFFYCFLKPFY